MSYEVFEVLMLILEFPEGVIFEDLRLATVVWYKKRPTDYTVTKLSPTTFLIIRK